MQLHQPLVLRQAVKLFLGVPPVQGFNHLVQLYHLLLQLDQAQVLGVRDLESIYNLVILSKGMLRHASDLWMALRFCRKL